MSTTTRSIILAVVLLAIAGAIWYLEPARPMTSGAASINLPLASSMRQSIKAKQYPTAKEIVDPSGFINSDPFKISDLIGKKVIMIDFWTYSCINCQRTLPYMTAWDAKYRDQGLEIVGVHTPEFDFEKNIDNVKAAVAQYGIKYPVVLDNDHATWDAYGNRYWPHKYLIDIDGYIVYDHIGEGGYEETEREIQALLKERQQVLGSDQSVSTDIARPKSAESPEDLPTTPEIYFGASRNEYLGNGVRGSVGEQQFQPPATVSNDTLYLLGGWNMVPEDAENKTKGASIVIKYHAAKVFFVASANSPVVVHVKRDGKDLTDVRGQDVDPNSNVTIQEPRLYRLIEDPAGYGEHTLELEIEGSGLQAYTFTFG